MDMNRFTEKSRQALQEAQSNSLRFGHQEVDIEHMALALVRQEDGLVPRLLEKAGYMPKAFAKALEDGLRRKPSVSGPGSAQGQMYITQRMDKAMLRAQDFAKALKDEYISVEHIFCSFLDEGSGTLMGATARQFGVTREKVLGTMENVRGSQRVT